MVRSSFILGLLLVATTALAAPKTATRVIRVFDFEERKLGNVEELPMNWEKIEGQGYPHYINARLTNDRARSGSYSFRFDLNGGALAYRYPSGLIPVQTGAHYRLDAYVRTTALLNARARITGYLTDADGHVLPKTINHSELYAAASESEDWKRLIVNMSADDPAAAFFVIELELLQPAQYASSQLGRRTLFTQDIHGTAWFDDVSIAQVPQVTVTSSRPGNIFRRDDPMTMRVNVSDRFTEDLSAQLVLKDADDAVVYQRSGALDMSEIGPSEAGEKSLALSLPAPRPGWYRASVVMSSGGKTLGSYSMDLIRLPDNAMAIAPDSRFGVIATDLAFDGWTELGELLPMMGVGRVKLALWSNKGDIQEVDADAFDRLIERFADLGITPTACLLEPPPALAKKLGYGGWTQILTRDPSIWQGDLAQLISKHASHLDRWQLGADDTEAFVTDPRMRRVYATVYREFAGLMHAPDLAMPWPAWYDFEGELPATVSLSVPPSVLPAQMPLYMQDIRSRKGHSLSLSLQLLDCERYGRLAQVKDLVQRVTYALSAGATRIDFPLPFQVKAEGDHLVKQPQEMMLVIRTLASTLGGATYKGKTPIADGVEAFLFDRKGQGIMVLWSRDNVASVKPLAINLGRNPVCIDPWGNVTPLLKVRGAKSAGKVQLRVGPMPIYLVDIDGPQAQLRASLAIDQPLMESSFEPHERRLRFTNPYPTLLSGTMHVQAPPGWTINPPTFVFSLNPGETFDRQTSISFPYNSFAGPRTVECEFQLQDGGTGSFTVPITLTLGLSDVGMQSLALRDGNDVVVQQMVSNYGKTPIDYNAFAVFPGQARQERLVTNLGPGSTVIKRYRFRNVIVQQGAKVRLGVKELDGVRVLNDEIGVQ